MSMNIKGQSDLCRFHGRKVWLFISLLFIVTLVSSCLASTFSNTSPFALGAPDRIVNNATELRDAVIAVQLLVNCMGSV